MEVIIRPMKLKFDPEYNIAYISFKDKTEQVNSIKVSEDITVDISPDGTLYGIELLNAKDQLLKNDWKNLTLVNENTGSEKIVELPH